MSPVSAAAFIRMAMLRCGSGANTPPHLWWRQDKGFASSRCHSFRPIGQVQLGKFEETGVTRDCDARVTRTVPSRICTDGSFTGRSPFALQQSDHEQQTNSPRKAKWLCLHFPHLHHIVHDLTAPALFARSRGSRVSGMCDLKMSRLAPSTAGTPRFELYPV